MMGAVGGRGMSCVMDRVMQQGRWNCVIFFGLSIYVFLRGFGGFSVPPLFNARLKILLGGFCDFGDFCTSRVYISLYRCVLLRKILLCILLSALFLTA